MREWSLHILDLVENSLRAGAHHVRVSVTDLPQADRMEIAVDDDGSGLGITSDQATDPFYTTKPGKRTGLGLSLLRFHAEQAGGGLTLGASELGGLRAVAVLKRSHVDRNPLGDLASTLSGVVASSAPDVVLEVVLGSGQRRMCVSTAGNGAPSVALALHVEERIRQMLSELSIEG